MSSFTPNSAGTQEGGRGSGGGGGSRSAGKRRGKKRNNRQNADTSPPLPDLQAQTLFAPGTTGGAADEEIANQITLEEAKRIQEAAHKARLEAERADAEAAAKAHNEAAAANAAAAEADVLAQLEEEEIKKQIEEQKQRLEKIRQRRQSSQSKQQKLVQVKGKEADEASKKHAAAVEATAIAKDALDSTTASLQKVTPRLKEHDPMDRIRYMYSIFADFARTHKHLSCVAEFDKDGKFDRVLHTWETQNSHKRLNNIDHFNDPEGVFPLPILKMLLLNHADVETIFNDQLVRCFDLNEPNNTGNIGISGRQAEWLITRVDEPDRVFHPLRKAETGDKPANKTQLFSLYYEVHSLHQIALEFIAKSNLSLQAAEDSAQTQGLAKKLAEASHELTKARESIMKKINVDALKRATKDTSTNTDRITNTDLEAVNSVLSVTMDTIFRTSPAMLYGVSPQILLARSGEAPFKDILSATGASVARHLGDKNTSDAKLTTPRTPEEIQRMQRQQSNMLNKRGANEQQNEVMSLQSNLGYDDMFVPVADQINTNPHFGEKLAEDKGAQLIQRIIRDMEIKPLIVQALKIKWHVAPALHMALTQLDCIEGETAKLIHEITKTKTKLLYRAQVSNTVEAAREAQKRSTEDGGDGAFLVQAFNFDPYTLLAVHVESTFKNLGQSANEIAMFSSACIHFHKGAFTNSRALTLFLIGEGLEYNYQKESPYDYFIRQNKRFTITQSQQTSVVGMSNPLFCPGIFESTLIYLTHTEIQRAASGTQSKKGLTNDNKKKINKIFVEFTNKQKAYDGPLQPTDGAYIADVFGGPEKAIQEYSALLQKASEQFTVTQSAKKVFDVQELEESISLIASGTSTSSPPSTSFKAQGTPSTTRGGKEITMGSEEEQLIEKSTILYNVCRGYEKLRGKVMKKPDSSEEPNKFFISAFNHFGIAVPTTEYQKENPDDSESPWIRNIKHIVQPLVMKQSTLPWAYAKDGNAFVFPIYSTEHQRFTMENMTPRNTTTTYKFSELYEELISVAKRQLDRSTVDEVLSHGITQAADVTSLLANIRDLAMGTDGKPGVFRDKRKPRKYFLRMPHNIITDLKEGGEPPLSTANDRTMSRYAHSVIRQVGYTQAARSRKGKGTAFLNSADIEDADDDSTTTADAPASPPSSISEQTTSCKPPPQTTDSAASSLTSDSASNDAFLQLAQDHNVEQIQCILDILQKDTVSSVKGHPHSTWEIALQYRKSTELGSQQNEVRHATANLAAAADEQTGSKV